MNLEQLQENLNQIMDNIIEKANLKENDVFVLGCSTSEVMGHQIGKHSSLEIGELIVQTLLNKLNPLNVHLAVQGCEHLNRSLVIESEVAESKGYEEVWVRPSLHAGGAASVSAFKLFKNPIEVMAVQAKAGIDIGDTFIGMHVKSVQVPIRPTIKTLGHAHVTAVTSRPRYVGGPRAIYEGIEIK